MDTPGIGQESFKLIFQKNIQQSLKDNYTQKIKIVSTPIRVYSNWCHRLLNILTFGYRYRSGWTYNVEIPQKRNKNRRKLAH